MANTIVLRLNNPHGGDPAQFNLLDQYIPDESNELIQTIRQLSEDHVALKEILDDYFKLPNRQSQFQDAMRRLCEKFNEWCEAYRSPAVKQSAEQQQQQHQQQGSTNQIRFIMQLIYNRAVLDPDKLNQYEPFSPQVYGETSFDLIDQMLKKVNLNENDVFLDLGSGVGNVVLHVAAVARCKRCYGFEKAEWPALYATRMEKEFKYWMNFFGKSYSDFRLYKADFLSEEEYLDVDVEPPNGSSSSTNVNLDTPAQSSVPASTQLRRLTMSDFVKEVINQSNLIFVNNYAFGAELDHQLKMRFLEMLEGSIIVSSKPFCPLNFRINDRNLNDIGAILNLSEIEALNGPVSWTDKPINYYFQKIDHTLLEKYFESKKYPQKAKSEPRAGDDQHGTSGKSSASSSPSTSVASSPTSPNSDHNNSSSLSSASGSSVASSSACSKSKRSKTAKATAVDRKVQAPTSGRKRKSSDFETPRADLNSSTSDVEQNGKLKRAKVTSEKKATKGKTHLAKLVSVTAAAAVAKKRSKSLDKHEKKTLEKMHESVSKISNGKATVLKKLASNSSGNFNAKAMTKLSSDNLDSKSLRESKISAKFLNKPANTPNKANNANKNANNSSKTNGNSVLNGSRSPITASNGLVDPDEVNARRELGDDVINAIDNYLKKCRKQYIGYLMYMKSCEYRNKSLMELQAENSIKKEMLIKKDLLEIQASNLVKANINLIRLRAAEIGIKDLKSPLEIIQHAKEVFSNHRELETRLKTATNGHQHPALMNGHSEANLIGRLIDSIESSRKTTTTINSPASKPVPPSVDEEDGEIVETMTNTNSSRKATSAPQPTSKHLDEYLAGVKGEDTLRNFKIPKQAKVEAPSVPPPPLPSTMADSCDSPTNHLINDSSCSNSPSFNMTNNYTNTFANHNHHQHQHSSQHKYYHPKKNQFRQYMMENQTTNDWSQ